MKGGRSDFYGAHRRVLHPSTEWILNYILCIRLKTFTPLEIMPRSVSSRNDWNF